MYTPPYLHHQDQHEDYDSQNGSKDNQRHSQALKVLKLPGNLLVLEIIFF